ncbi:multidrug ABC transporter ATP-binding protein [Mycolicibacterium duvalii]|uniref:ABC transporter permease n=1 Tax=Mycolicibacterium duvalii TaxID=39688 RepID=A0A7I7JZG0_9MYCO|nr:ABC transporter ATP-binding protein/permease [Mycolicibacterium duvalii]MCV7365926.1 ABC transporter ATP-binding protein/permease [Mycolicibacterium duvalii]PEG35545.1 multidrug ABC transporter ATP-binding protein [Mycolicibacterium duvalii]BBX16472.1 ABC transporter permease [Mycolicibacterium duvalii]
MDTQTFQPSLDWSREVFASAVWVATAWILTAICLLLVLALIARFTEWGRQFWRVSGEYFTGRRSLVVWLMVGLLLLSVIVSVRINVLLTYYVNDLFTSLQVAFAGGPGGAGRDSGIAGFWATMLVFAVLAGLFLVRLLLDLYLTQRFIMRWRIWLSRRFIDGWLGDLAYYRAQFAGRPIDNPDQRIQQDVDIFTTGVGGYQNNPNYTSSDTLLFGAVHAVLSVLSFGPILWRLSEPLTLGGVTVPHALFWVVLIYVFVATVVAFVIGRPLIRLSYLNERRNAAFRFGLVRVRETGAAIGLYRGEPAERSLLRGRLDAVMTNYRHWLNRMMLFFGWNVTVSQAINPLPWLVQAQGLFAQRISFGDVWQSSNAFGAIHESLSFFRNAYDQFASYRAAIIRLDGLAEQNDRAGDFSSVHIATSGDGALEVAGVAVRRPDGTPLVHDLDLTVGPGEALVITGESGIGKSVLLQSIAGLWPFASGRVRLPRGRDEVMFVPQLPYLPVGDLRTVVTYPQPPGAVDDKRVQKALLDVALAHLAIRLNEDKDWANALSVGEQQRIAFARILLSRPAAIFLDESTSALDEGLELMLYQLLRAELPDAIIVSVSHRSSVHPFHGSRLDLVGDGAWRLERLAPSG